MSRNGRRLSLPSLAREMWMSLYLGAILEAGVNITAQPFPPLFCFFALIVRMLCNIYIYITFIRYCQLLGLGAGVLLARGDVDFRAAVGISLFCGIGCT